MTAPATRPSLNFAFKVAESVGGSVKRLVAAAMLFAPGAIWFMKEMNVPYSCDEPLHVKHLSFAVGLMVAGAIALQPSFGTQLSGIFVTVFPNGLPMLGGKRATDPQPPESENKQ